jgi:hypothetical protein
MGAGANIIVLGAGANIIPVLEGAAADDSGGDRG